MTDSDFSTIFNSVRWILGKSVLVHYQRDMFTFVLSIHVKTVVRAIIVLHIVYNFKQLLITLVRM